MHTPPLRCWAIGAALLLAAGPLRAQTLSKIEPLGDHTYRVTATATNKFTRNTAKLKEAGIAAAREFCAREGREFQLVAASEKKSFYLVGEMAATQVTFKALAPGDPELAPAPAPAARPVPAPTATDALYDELIKLDELRKKGILTEEEFAAQKKKVLDRSK